ncbi:hypothetical protein BYT27DRAFT_6962753 [Phlegmacium glaucopus]|nr:hypothetical protein BYT27DRAFT_6962753 [Phlegmacium glaucopus]
MQLLAVTSPSIVYICLGGFVFTLSLVSLIAREKVYVNLEVVLGTAFGIFMGPYFAGVIDPRSWASTGTSNDITLEVMRIVLATGLFAIGVELPKRYMAQHAKSLSIMVIPTMGIGWVVVAGLLRLLFPRFHFISCLAISACLTPTDPIICSTIVGGKFAKNYVPEKLRHLLSAESAANDGLAYPFLTLSLYLTIESSRGVAITRWLLIGCLYQVLFGAIMGAILGLTFSYLFKFSHKRGFINRESYVAQYLMLAIFVIGIVSTIGSDDLLAAFAAGCAVSWDGEFAENTEGEVFASVIDLILNCACFIYIGAWIPFDAFTLPDLGINPWRLAVLVCGIMILRRIPAMLVLYKWIPEIASWRQAFFSGHFGPMGVGAVFISTLALHKLPPPSNPPQSQQDILALAIPSIVSFVVLSSIFIHGLSIPLFNLGRCLTATATARSKTNLDWPTHSDLTSFSREATLDVPNVGVDEGEKGATSTNDPRTDTLQQEHSSGGERIERVHDIEAPSSNKFAGSSNKMGVKRSTVSFA